MKIILSILQFLNRFYWCKRLYHKYLLNYFYKYHLSNIIKEINSNYRISEYSDLLHVMKQSSFRGLISGYFYPNNFYPTPLNFAIAINVSIYAYCNEKSTDNKAIIDASYHIAIEIKERISFDDFLKDLFKISNKTLDKIITDYPRNEIEKVFNDKKLLFKTYFKTYGNENFSTKIKIWHQGYTTSWIDWKEEDSLDLPIDLNKIREGFFLIGFEYIINNEYLRVAYKREGFEYYNREIENGELVWLN